MGVKFINPFMVKPVSAGISVAGTATYASSTKATSHAINLPSGIQAGDLLLVVAVSNGTTAFTVPSGWTAVQNTAAAGANRVFYKIASGSEGSTQNFTTPDAGCAAVSYRITGAHQTTAPAIGTAVVATNAAPNPPSLTPSWGSANNLWIALWTSVTRSTVSAYPTDHTLNQNRVATSAGDACALAVAGRITTASVLDPAAFTVGASASHRANTIAVRPA